MEGWMEINGEWDGSWSIQKYDCGLRKYTYINVEKIGISQYSHDIIYKETLKRRLNGIIKEAEEQKNKKQKI